MLIRFATEKDLPAWYALATEVSQIFQHPDDMGTDSEFATYTQSKVSKYEALTAVDYMSGKNMGFIGFSRTNNRISWFAVSERYRNKGVGGRLLKTALRQLDTMREISVTTFRDGYLPGAPARAVYAKFGFTDRELTTHDGLLRSLMVRPASDEKRGGSFHYRYPEFIKAADKAFCPVCNAEPAPDGQTDIEINDKVCVCGEYPGELLNKNKKFFERDGFLYIEYLSDKKQYRRKPLAKGRPKKQSVKENRITIRMDKEITEILNNYCRTKNMSESEAIRRAIMNLNYPR